MKTLTEFSGFALKDALAKKAALIAEGKTEEEALASIHEQLKLADETKMAFFKNAVDMTSSRLDRVKRVVIAVKATETEKVPEAFSEREGHFYLVEFFPQADSRGHSQSRGGRDDRDSRGGRNGRGRSENGRGGRDGRGGDNRGRNDRGRGFGGRTAEGSGEGSPRPERTPRTDRPDSRGPRPDNRGPRPERAARPDRAPKNRGPRPPRNPQGPRGAGELRLVLKGQSATTLAGSGAQRAEAPANAVALNSAEGSSGSNPATS